MLLLREGKAILVASLVVAQFSCLVKDPSLSLADSIALDKRLHQIASDGSRNDFEKFSSRLEVTLALRGTTGSSIHASGERLWFQWSYIYLDGYGADFAPFLKSWTSSGKHEVFKQWMLDNRFAKINQDNGMLISGKMNLSSSEQKQILDYACNLFQSKPGR